MYRRGIVHRRLLLNAPLCRGSLSGRASLKQSVHFGGAARRAGVSRTECGEGGSRLFHPLLPRFLRRHGLLVVVEPIVILRLSQ